jgi:hypothetical protein
MDIAYIENKYQIIIKQPKKLEELMETFDVGIKNNNLFRAVLKEYIVFELMRGYEKGSVHSCVTGWSHQKVYQYTIQGFSCVTIPSYDLDIENLIFGGKAKAIKKITSDDTIENAVSTTETECVKKIGLKYSNALSTIMQVIEKNPDILICFSYDLLAISGYLITKMDEPAKAVLGISGRNTRIKLTACKVANTLCNVLSTDLKRLNSIDFKRHVSCTSIKFDDKRFVALNNIPVLVSERGYNIKKNSTRFSEILKIAEQTEFYPVFVSNDKINLDEVIEVDIENITYFPNDMEELGVLKDALNDVLLTFILVIQRLLMETMHSDAFYYKGRIDWIRDNNQNKINEIKANINKFKVLLDNDAYDINKTKLYLPLYIAVTLLCGLTSDDWLSKHINTKLLEFTQKIISQRCICDGLSESNQFSDMEIFNQYILDIFENNTHTPDYIYWEGRENKGNGEECYYFEYSKYFDDFRVYSMRTIRQSEFNKALKSSERVIMKADKSSLGVTRTYGDDGEKKKKVYCLAVRKCVKNDVEGGI